KSWLPRQREPWAHVVLVVSYSTVVRLRESGEREQSRAEIKAVDVLSGPALRFRRRFQEPGHAIVNGKVRCESPGILDVRHELRGPKLHRPQSVQHSGDGKAQEEIRKRVPRVRRRPELPLRVLRPLSREDGLERQPAQG